LRVININSVVGSWEEWVCFSGFKVKSVGGGPTCQSLCETLYSGFLLLFSSFKFKVVGSGPTASHFFQQQKK